jgi:hypothetical protein
MTVKGALIASVTGLVAAVALSVAFVEFFLP